MIREFQDRRNESSRLCLSCSILRHHFKLALQRELSYPGTSTNLLSPPKEVNSENYWLFKLHRGLDVQAC